MAARSALFAVGFELAGVRLQLFAERLFQAADASPDASCDELVRTAMEAIYGGALALAADEPDLSSLRLSAPATTVQEAAETAVHALGVALLHGRRRG